MQTEYFSNIRSRSSVDYLLRTVHQHHVQLSLMADQKANILIAASFVILSLALGFLQRGTYVTGIVILMAFIAVAASLAIFAVMPLSSPDKVKRENPLFFGNFASTDEDTFFANLESTLETDASLYRAISRDIYQMGRTIYYTKYRYLRWSYRFFLSGFFSGGTLIVFEILGWVPSLAL
ncbi:Pycsar system effector family protein [Leptospira gomenensis]|nr:Pycsar system effector family protein [Leptospira gomenensis]